MLTKSFNRVHVETATTGAGTLTLGGAAAANVINFLQAGAVDGDKVNYVIENGADFEIGVGTLGNTLTTLTRDIIHISKAAGSISTTRLNLASASRVRSAETADLFNHMFPAGELTKTAAYNVVLDDRNKVITCNSATGVTFTLDPVANLGVKFAAMFKNLGAGVLTLDPNGAETIDGATTLTLKQGQSVLLLGNGATFRTMFFSRSNLADLGDIDFVTIPPATGDGLVYDSAAGKWKPGAAGGGMFRGNLGQTGSRAGDIFRINAKTVTANVTIGATENASATGPIEVATGFTLEVATGGTLVIL